jgi:hypothetical protein
MPIWIQDPVEEMFVELIQDLQDALAPLLDMSEQEYKGRIDRLAIIKDAKERFEFRRKMQSGIEECHCAGCEDNRDIEVKNNVKVIKKPRTGKKA